MHLTVLILAAALAAPAGGQAAFPPLYHKAMAFIQKRGPELGLKYELQEQAAVPQWAKGEPEPLFRFVHMTDLHYNRRVDPFLRKALRMIREDIKPAFVVSTGDLCNTRQQPALRRVLEQGLAGIPHYATRGDNWPWGFGEAFGPYDWSFTCGGVGFVAAALDRDIVGLGIGLFEPDTWQWLTAALDSYAGRPVVFFMHENVMPPTFLDAPRLLRAIQARPYVVATVSGHLHYDYAIRIAGQLHLVGPGFGPHPRHPFKVYEVHRDHITVRTVKWRGGRFQYVTLYQRIDFPGGMRLALPANGQAKV